jgi:hypothetical protein
MKKTVGFLTLALSAMLATPAAAGEVVIVPTSEAAYCCEPPRGRLYRFWDRLTTRSYSNTCGQGKTHLDMGCTDCRADCIFVFGNCCEFFDNPETYRSPLERWRGGRR